MCEHDIAGIQRGVDNIDNKIEFWKNISEKLYTAQDIYSIIPGALQDLCRFLDIGFGFLYLSDYKGQFTLNSSYLVLDEYSLPTSIELAQHFTEDEIDRLVDENVVYYKDGMDNPLYNKVADIFGARFMMLLPLTNDNVIHAMLGIADQRAVLRTGEEDSSFCYSVLCTLASNIKQRLCSDAKQSTQSALESIIDNMGVDIYVNDLDTHEVLYVNRSMAQPYGGVDNMLGKVCWQALYTDRSEECDYCPRSKLIDENGNPTNLYTWDYQRPFDGSWYRVLSTAFEWVDGRLAHLVSSFDITENKRNEDTIKRMASFDDLTGLPNRSKLKADCNALVEQEAAFDVIFFDLDGFKAVNDKHTHDAGDAMLVELADRMMDADAFGSDCYRYGGDEFVVICRDEGGMTVEEALARLRGIFAQGFAVKNEKQHMAASVGISCYPEDGDDTSTLLMKADKAMYYSKTVGDGSPRFYNKIDDTSFDGTGRD